MITALKSLGDISRIIEGGMRDTLAALWSCRPSVSRRSAKPVLRKVAPGIVEVLEALADRVAQTVL